MSNPNADRIAALSRQDDEVLSSVSTQYLVFASEDSISEEGAARLTLQFAQQWLDLIGQTEEPTDHQKAIGLRLQNFLAQPGGEYREPLARLLVAVSEGDTTNPNPTPAFGSLR